MGTKRAQKLGKLFLNFACNWSDPQSAETLLQGCQEAGLPTELIDAVVTVAQQQTIGPLTPVNKEAAIGDLLLGIFYGQTPSMIAHLVERCERAGLTYREVSKIVKNAKGEEG